MVWLLSAAIGFGHFELFLLCMPFSGGYTVSHLNLQLFMLSTSVFQEKVDCTCMEEACVVVMCMQSHIMQSFCSRSHP